MNLSIRVFSAFVMHGAVILVLFQESALAQVAISYNRDVRPILANHCFNCHGPDSSTREAGLRLDRRDAATAKTESGVTAIVPEMPAASELINRITSIDPDLRMPPVDGGKRMTDKQIKVLTAWVKQGAQYEKHWSFVTPTRPAVPIASKSNWIRNEIDHFVLRQLDQRQLEPSAEATPEALIRRVALDVTGLPPTISEIDRFLADQEPKAYERMVDRYLASNAYGEHMARHWLDLARYADTNGYQYDTERQQWVWRDWVIDAYNRNMRFDQFTIQQLAGDLLPNSTPQQRLATGFNRNHGITIEGGVIDEEYRTEYVMDRLVTTGEVWLGLTIGCARCHEHKFDPISQREFYQLYAFFNQLPERGRGAAPQERIPSPLAAARQKELDAALAKLKDELARPQNLDEHLERWTSDIAKQPGSGWQVLVPKAMKSTGGTTLTRLDDNSILASGANPRKDIYEIATETNLTGINGIRMEALTHPSLPGGGPGRHSNSNFVLSEFEATAVSLKDSSMSQRIKFVRAIADYSQRNYEIGKTIDGTVAGNNGWAVDGPTRKKPVTAMFVASKPFGFEGGTRLEFRLRHEANFATHGVGRPRFSVATSPPDTLSLKGLPADIQNIARKPKNGRDAAEQKRLQDYFLKHHHPNQSLKQRIAALEKQKSSAFPATMIMQDMAKPRKTFVLNRGQYNQPTEEVTAGVPGVFPPLGDGVPKNRLGLARWLVDPKHPLTARVAVNRYWQRLFGVGLVKTSEDFGIQGELPSHPELLDWLANEFIRSGWNVKHIHRLILNSATYRQSSHAKTAAFKADPDNRWLARGPRFRMDAEEIRDLALATSGLLVKRLGGRSVYPYQPAGLWLELNNRPGYSKAYPLGTGDDLYRRSMYIFWKRTVPSPMMKTFDAPEREFCTLKRSRTNTPLQALLMLNGPQFVEAARVLGERMLKEGGDSRSQRLEFGFRLVTARRPTDRELEVLSEVLVDEQARFVKDAEAASKLLGVGAFKSEVSVAREELAAYASVARLLLNVSEAITKG